MTIAQVLELEKDNWDKIYLFPVGGFYKAYEHSACLFHTHVRPFKASKRFVKSVNRDVVSLGFPYYGRYVDDFYLVDRDKARLLDAIGPIRDFLHDELLLTLHPRKVYLQPVARGVKFLGAFLKLGERYPIPRTMSKYHKSLAVCLPFLHIFLKRCCDDGCSTV